MREAIAGDAPGGRKRPSALRLLLGLLVFTSIAATGSLFMIPLLQGYKLDDLKKNFPNVKVAVKLLMALYMEFLHATPLKTKIVTSVLLYSLSDVIAQIVEAVPRLSVIRTVRFAGFGGPIWTSFLHWWYHFIEMKIRPDSFRMYLLMACVDQGVGSPFYVVLYFTYDSVFKGSGFADAVTRLFNFYFVPLNLRILSVNVMALVWNILFSMMTNAVKTEAEESTGEQARIPKLDPKKHDEESDSEPGFTRATTAGSEVKRNTKEYREKKRYNTETVGANSANIDVP